MIREPIDAAAVLRSALARASDPVVMLLALVGAMGSVGITIALHELGIRPEHGQLVATYLATILTSACTLVITSITFAAMTLRVVARERGETLSLGASLGAGFRMLHLVYAAQALTSIATAIGLALCILPGVYVSFLLAATSTLAAAERLGPFAAIDRTRSLVEGRLGSMASVVVPLWLLIGLVLLAAIVCAGAFMPTSGVARYVAVLRDIGALETLPVIFAITASRAIGTALWCAAMAVVYLRLRAHEDPSEAEKLAEVFA